MTIRSSLLLLAAGMVAASPLVADVYPLFNEDASFFTGITYDPADPDLGWGVTNPATDGGGGMALRIYDNSVVSGTGTVKLRGDLPMPVKGLMQLSFFMLTTNADDYGDSGDALKVRIGNDTWLPDIGSSSATAISIEPRMDNDFRVKSLDGDYKAGSGYLDPGVWYKVDVVANFAGPGGDSLSYTMGDTQSTLAPQTQDVWLDGVKIVDGVAFQGSNWVVQATTDSTYPGAQSIGFMTDSTKLGGEYFFDKIMVYTGSDVGTVNTLAGTDGPRGMWGGMTIGADGWVNTEGGTMLYPFPNSPWVYVGSLHTWAFIDADSRAAIGNDNSAGFWGYFFNQASAQ